MPSSTTPNAFPADGRTGAAALAASAGSSAKGRDQARRLARRVRRRAEDLVLVEAVLRGDDEAFRELVERYQKRIYWIAYDIVLDSDEARDVAQETFIRVHAALDRFDRKRDFLNWIYRIARNLAIDSLRRRKRRAVSLDDLSALSLPAPASERPDPAVGARVARVLEDLPVDYRLALTLREFHDMTPREIARITDCSYPTARWRLHRARALFRKAWEMRYGAATLGEDTV